MSDSDKAPPWAGGALIVAVLAVLYSCSQDGNHKQTVDELRSQAVNAEAEANRANERADQLESQVSDLESKASDLEDRVSEMEERLDE